MNLRHAIANIDLNNHAHASWLPFDKLYSNILDYHYVPGELWGLESFDVKQYKIKTWMCTDTLVGLYAYFFRDEFAFVTSQTGRKCDINFYWVNQEMHTKVADYLRSFIKPEDMDIVELNDMHYDINIDNYGH